MVLIVYMAAYLFGGVYRIMWRYAGVHDVARLSFLSCIACGLTLCANQFMNLGLFRGVLVFIGLIGTIAIGGSRILYRVFHRDRIPGGLGEAAPVMIVGAGEAGAYAVNICNKNPKRLGKPVLLVDDAKAKQGLRIQNVPIRGTTEDIPKLAQVYGIQTPAQLHRQRMDEEKLKIERERFELEKKRQAAVGNTEPVRIMIVKPEEVEGDADSLAGLLLELKGDFPELHESIDFHHLTFEVMEMDERRIVKIKVVVHNTSKSDADA